MKANTTERKPWMRFATSGTEIAIYTIVCGAIGYVIDQRAGNQRPVISAFFGLVGFCFGMVRFIRMANAVNREAEANRRKKLDAESNHSEPKTDD